MAILVPSFKYKDYSVNDLVAASFPVSASWASPHLFTGGGDQRCRRGDSRPEAKYPLGLRGDGGSGRRGYSSFVVAPLLGDDLLPFTLHWLPGGGWNGGALKFMIPLMVALSTAYIASIALRRGSMIGVLHL
ncbi:hypothetical protein MJ579_17490 [Klebsiella pneumoniae]|nr:hypothetical protein MJ579_17490 [Klebsiella pneumoniae]